MMYKILNEGYAPFMYDTVNDYVRGHNHNTRNQSTFYIWLLVWNNLENVFNEAGGSSVLKTYQIIFYMAILNYYYIIK